MCPMRSNNPPLESPFPRRDLRQPWREFLSLPAPTSEQRRISVPCPPVPQSPLAVRNRSRQSSAELRSSAQSLLPKPPSLVDVSAPPPLDARAPRSHQRPRSRLWSVAPACLAAGPTKNSRRHHPRKGTTQLPERPCARVDQRHESSCRNTLGALRATKARPVIRVHFARADRGGPRCDGADFPCVNPPNGSEA